MKNDGRRDYFTDTDSVCERLVDHIESIKINFEEKVAPQRVLIIDDDKVVQEMIGVIFEEKQFKTYYSDTLFHACFHLKSYNPQIIILDLNLINENGADLLKIKEKYFPKSIVIIISGSDDHKIYDAIDIGADLYLKKPFAVRDLERIIDKFFGSNKVAS